MSNSKSTSSEFESLLPVSWKQKVSDWIGEDVPSFDYGGYVVGDKLEKAALLGKAKGVFAGRPFVDEIFRQLDCKVTWFLSEGEEFEPIKVVAEVTGTARNLLIGERTALNVIARASGVATRARRLKNLKSEKKWHGVIAGTRKTTPGFRLVEKYAMLVGGVDTHRMDLSSMIMLKDNHVWSQGSITNAVKKAKSVGGFSLKVEVEARTEEEAEEAIQAGADIVMLDNFDSKSMKLVAANLKKRHPHVLIEGSGGLKESNLHEFFSPDIDILSMGSLSQSVPHIDFSLKIQKSKL